MLFIRTKTYNVTFYLGGYLEDVVTKKGYEGIGVGKTLVNEISKIAKERGCKKILLNCKTENVDFYKKCGYEMGSNNMVIYL